MYFRLCAENRLLRREPLALGAGVHLVQQTRVASLALVRLRVVGIAAVAGGAFRLQLARVRLAYWRLVVVTCIALPVLYRVAPEETSGLSPTIAGRVGLSIASDSRSPVGTLASLLSFVLLAGAIVRGVTRTVGNELDEFVTEALRNNLVGLPLDLAVLNLARGRGHKRWDTGDQRIPARTRDRRAKEHRMQQRLPGLRRKGAAELAVGNGRLVVDVRGQKRVIVVSKQIGQPGRKCNVGRAVRREAGAARAEAARRNAVVCGTIRAAPRLSRSAGTACSRKAAALSGGEDGPRLPTPDLE